MMDTASGFRTHTSNCPDFPANSLILLADTFQITVRGHHCPKRHREGSVNSLNQKELQLRTVVSGDCPVWCGRTPPLSIERGSIRPVLKREIETQSREGLGEFTSVSSSPTCPHEHQVIAGGPVCQR
jgi:hypothetical protein